MEQKMTEEEYREYLENKNKNVPIFNFKQNNKTIEENTILGD